ncbi:ATP-binding cassette sub-family A member 1, partial [Biomphalaria glabrata]
NVDVHPAMLHVSNLLRYDRNITEFLLNLGLSQLVVDTFLTAAVYTNQTFFLQQSILDITNILCNPLKLVKVMTLSVTAPVSLINISSSFCSSTPQGVVIAEYLKNSSLSSAVINSLITSSPSNLIDTINSVLPVVRDLLSEYVDVIKFFITSIIETNIFVFQDSYSVVDQLVQNNTLTALSKQLQLLMSKLVPVFPPKYTSVTVMSSIQTIFNGLIDADILKGYLLPEIQVKSLLKYPMNTTNYFTSVLGITENVAQEILNAVFSSGILQGIANYSSYTCNEVLKRLVFVNTTKATFQNIQTEICALNTSQVVKLLNVLIPELDISALISKYVSYISATMLQQTNVTSKELEGLASTVNKGVIGFVETYQQLNQSQSKMDIVQLFFASSKSSMTSFDKISHSLCGKKLSGVSLLTSLGTNLPIVKTLVNSIQTEFAGLNNDISGACQDLFKTISDLELGNVLWNYLKPVLLGKILYTPDNELTRTILSKANKTFALVGELNRIAKAWADQAGNLQVLLDFIKDSSPFKDALNNEAIQDILRATTGIEPELLLTSLSTLENTTFSNDILETLQSVAATVANYTSCILADRFQPVSNETEMENMAFQLSKSKTFFAGIVFYDVDENNNATRQKRQASKYTIPKHIGYKIRMEVDSVMDTNLLKERIFTMSSESSFIEKLLYLRGFIFLQDLLDSEIIELHKNQSFSSPAINLIQMPFPCHRADGFQYFLGTYCVPTMLCFVFLSLLAVATFNLVSDKENGQTEALCVMGMLKGVHFLAWFLSTMFMMLTVAIIMAVMLKYTNIFINSNLFIMFLLMACFSLCSTMMIYMVAAFFTQTSMSFLFATVLYFLLFLPFTLFVSLEYQLTSWQLILASLCSTSSFGFGIFKISILEEQNIGIQWSNINVSLNEQPSFAWSMYFLLIDSAIFFLVGWYVQEIKPGHYGLGEKFYFPFQLSYWKRFFKYKLPTREMTGRMTHTESNWFEAMPADVKVGISVENISKVYNNKKVLDQLDLQFYENQITSLLGHNGAAKTTTIKIICGLLKPTSGYVSFSNNSLLGLCPQQNSFFNYMTVKENMRFYAGVKNDRSKNKKIISLEIYRLLKEVDLWQNRNIPARNLSYGMKRRLCVALAFVGGSTSIILDEPTSGIDPHTRKHIWNLLTKNRTGRTIVLSTHHLDEADFLSDRIGVMHQGKLICCGSPTFLKQSVGGGYRLTIMKADQTSLRQDQPQEIIDLRSKSSTAAITMFIQSLCSNATLEEQAGSDLIFNLPKDHGLIVPIDEFFRRLDQSVNQLNIDSYGLSDTSLEEIFLKLTKSADQDLSNISQATKTKVPNQQSSRVDFDDGQSRTGSLDPLFDMNYRRTGMKLKLVHIEALILKRLHHYRRNWRMLVSSIFLPMSFVLLSLIFNSFRPDDLDPKPLLLDPSIYGSGINSFYQDTVKSDMTNKLVHELVDNNIGYGAACMKDWQQKYFKTDKCVSKSPWYNNSLPMYKVECVDSLQTFTSQSTNYLIPEKHVQADNFIQNLNDWSIPSFLINTFEMYKQNRFGGWSFESLDKNDSLDTYVWFNTKGYHSMPSYYNALTNTILRAQLPDGRNSSEYGITAVNHPIRLSGIQLNFKSLITYTTDLEVSLLMLVAFTFVPCGCVLFVVTEKTMKERQLQSISGMTSITYWTVTFIWDMFMYCCTICLGVIWIVLVKPDSFYLKDNLAAFSVAILLYGWCMIPLVYSVSRLFNNGGKAYFSIFISSVLLATITLVSFLTITFFSYMTTGYKVLKYLLLIVPQFSIGQGLTDMATNTALYNIFKRYNEDRFVSPFSTEILGWNLLAMALEGVIFFVLNLLLDGVRQPVLSLDQESSLLEQTLSEDEDVIREKERIQQGLGNDLLIVDNLSKVYKKNGRKFFAVNHISFGVPEGQCFGLLGVNGAGKTTTFRMLTGDCLPSCGTVILKGERLSKKDTHFGQNVGYCPQEGGLDEYLTAEEMLYFHARLRGLHPWQTEILVNELLVELGLTQYAHKAVHTYSGGTKRKLALGVALLGHPPIVYLDEPTTGMDAATRRLAWKCIEKATRNGQSVILTSHSMDECDTLCSTLAIMVDGEIKCIGSPQHLKHKFGDGYIVTIHKGNKLLTDICHDFVNRFTGSEVTGKHHSCVKLQVPFTSFSLANILTYLQAAQEVQSISFYSVTQTTLDSVFIKFAHEQSTGFANNISDNYEVSKSSSQPPSSDSGSTFSKEVSTSVSNSDLENLSGFKNPAFLGHISTKVELSPADTNSRRRYVSIIPIKPQK